MASNFRIELLRILVPHWLKNGSFFSDIARTGMEPDKTFEAEEEIETEGSQTLMKNFTVSSSTRNDPLLQ